MPEMLKETDIIQSLDQLAYDLEIQILLAAEVGPRAWGYGQPEQPLHVTFLYAHAPTWYYQVFPEAQKMEIQETESLHFHGIDIQKALYMAAKSDLNVLECLASNHQLGPDYFGQWLQLHIGEGFDPAHAFSAYLKRARQFDEVETVTIQSQIEVIWSQLCAFWIARHHMMPTMNFDQLLEELVYPDNPDCFQKIEAMKHQVMRIKDSSEPTTFEDKDVLRFMEENFVVLENARPPHCERLDKTYWNEVFRDVIAHSKVGYTSPRLDEF